MAPKKKPAPPAAVALRPPASMRAPGDPMARSMAQLVTTFHGADTAITFDMSEELGAPRGYVSTQNLALDRAIGIPGFPFGRIVEVSGWEGCGKTTIAMHTIAECAAMGGVGILVDPEHAWDRNYMLNLGVDPERLTELKGSTAEEYFDLLETWVRYYSSMNALAWADSMRRAKIECSPPPTYIHKLNGKDKKSPQYVFAKWGRDQAGAILAYQRREGLAVTGIRDKQTRDRLRPVILFGDERDQKEALASWLDGGTHHMAVSADRPVVAVWDSVGGTATDEEVAGRAGDSHVASAAKVWRLNLRRMTGLLADNCIVVVLVNQRYTKIATGFAASHGHGGGSETYGGGGIKFHSSVRLELKKTGDIYPPGTKREEEWKTPTLGQLVTVEVAKNRLATPFVREEFALVYGRGVENAVTLFNDLKERGVITGASGWYRFSDPALQAFVPGGKSWQGGWMALSNMMAENPALYDALVPVYLAGRAPGIAAALGRLKSGAVAPTEDDDGENAGDE